MKKYSLIFLTLLILASAHTTQAAGRFYAGFALGETKVSDWCNRRSKPCKDSDVGLKAFSGFQITRHWGIEAAYLDLGQVSFSDAMTITTTRYRNARITGFTLSGTGTFPASKKLDLFAKGGFFRWTADMRETTAELTRAIGLNDLPRLDTKFENRMRQQEGINFTFGVGAAFSFTQALQVRLEWEQFLGIGDQNTFDIQFLSGGMVLFF